MNCREFQERLAAASAAPDRDVQAHLRDCESCRALARTLASLSSGPAPSAALEDRLRAIASREQVPVRPPAALTWRAARFLFAVLLVSSAGIAALGTAGWRSLPFAPSLFLAFGFAVGASAAAWILARLMIPGLGAAWGPVLLPLLAAASYLLLIAFHFQEDHYDRFIPTAAVCFALGSLHTLLTVILTIRILRAGWVTQPRRAALAGVSLGTLSGLLVLTVFCSHHDLWHLVLGHFSVLIVWPLAAYKLGHWFAAQAKR
jgi:predicted anti-sigma-YlaC factor YlaD